VLFLLRSSTRVTSPGHNAWAKLVETLGCPIARIPLSASLVGSKGVQNTTFTITMHYKCCILRRCILGDRVSDMGHHYTSRLCVQILHFLAKMYLCDCMLNPYFLNSFLVTRLFHHDLYQKDKSIRSYK